MTDYYEDRRRRSEAWFHSERRADERYEKRFGAAALREKRRSEAYEALAVSPTRQVPVEFFRRKA